MLKMHYFSNAKNEFDRFKLLTLHGVGVVLGITEIKIGNRLNYSLTRAHIPIVERLLELNVFKPV